MGKTIDIDGEPVEEALLNEAIYRVRLALMNGTRGCSPLKVKVLKTDLRMIMMHYVQIRKGWEEMEALVEVAKAAMGED